MEDGISVLQSCSCSEKLGKAKKENLITVINARLKSRHNQRRLQYMYNRGIFNLSSFKLFL